MCTDLTLSGLSKSSRVYDSAALVSGSCNGSLLTIKPALSNLSPFVPCNQRIPFSGNGLNGQSVAQRTAKTAAAQTAFARFPSPGGWTCSFTGEIVHMTLRRCVVLLQSIVSVDKRLASEWESDRPGTLLGTGVSSCLVSRDSSTSGRVILNWRSPHFQWTTF